MEAEILTHQIRHLKPPSIYCNKSVPIFTNFNNLNYGGTIYADSTKISYLVQGVPKASEVFVI